MTEKIDFSKSEQYTLSIRLSTDGFSFSIYNPLSSNDFFYQKYDINAQHSMAANVKQFINDTQAIKNNFRRVNIFIASNRYTSIPLDFFNEANMESIYYQNVTKENNEIVLCNMLSRSNIAIVFSIDKLTHLYFSEQFPAARFYATVSPITEDFSFKSKQGNSNKLYANIRGNHIDLFAFCKGRLLFLNSFKTTCSEDICYYILNVWKQLNYDQERDELHIYGNTQMRKETSEKLQEFLKHIFIINPQAEFNSASPGGEADTIPLEMQSIITCE